MMLFTRLRNAGLGIFSYMKEQKAVTIFSCLLVPFVAMSGGCIDTYGVVELKATRDDYVAAIEENKNELILIQKRIDKLKGRAAEPLAIREGIEKILTEKRKAQVDIEELEVNLRKNMAVLRACQESFKVKVSLESGTKFESIALENGKELRNAIYKGFSDGRIRFSHAGGIGVFPFDQMPDSIARYVILPPSTPSSAVDPESILARKPDILKSNSQIRKDAENAQSAEYAAIKLKREEEQKRREGEDAKMTAERTLAEKMREKKRQENAKQRIIIQNEINRYERGLKSLDGSFKDQKASWVKGKITVSKADQQRTIEIYNSKLKGIEQKIGALQKQLSALGY